MGFSFKPDLIICHTFFPEAIGMKSWFHFELCLFLVYPIAGVSNLIPGSLLSLQGLALTCLNTPVWVFQVHLVRP